jgi:uncharacterized protein YhbP (UPF0306 family)
MRRKTLDYLKKHNVLTLATDGPQGLWTSAVFYVNSKFNLFFLSSPESLHALNIAANPRISAAVHEDYRDWQDIKGIQLEGEARRITGLEQSKAAIQYGLKFPIVRELDKTPREILRALDRMAWFKVVPKRLFFVYNSLGFGHREEIPL